MMNVSDFITGWGWRIRLKKIAPILCDGATCIESGFRFKNESFCSKFVGGSRKGGYGCRDGIGHLTLFVVKL